MRKFLAAAMGSLVVLVGLAGAANAIATVDLIWIDVSVTDGAGNPVCLEPANRNCPPDPRSPDSGVTINSLTTSDTITLAVIITASTGGVVGGGVSVDYSDVLQIISGVNFSSLSSTIPPWLPDHFGLTSNMPPFIDNINATSIPYASIGTGLPANQSAYLGTVSFHLDQLVNGTYEIEVGAFGPGGTDGIGKLSLQDITSTTTFRSAFITIPEPSALPALGSGIAVLALLHRRRRHSEER